LSAWPLDADPAVSTAGMTAQIAQEDHRCLDRPVKTDPVEPILFVLLDSMSANGQTNKIMVG
jgi:hypothetical protein